MVFEDLLEERIVKATIVIETESGRKIEYELAQESGVDREEVSASDPMFRYSDADRITPEFGRRYYFIANTLTVRTS